MSCYTSALKPIGICSQLFQSVLLLTIHAFVGNCTQAHFPFENFTTTEWSGEFELSVITPDPDKSTVSITLKNGTAICKEFFIMCSVSHGNEQVKSAAQRDFI